MSMATEPVIRIGFDWNKPCGGLRLVRRNLMLYEQGGHLFAAPDLRWVAWTAWVVREDMSFDDAYDYVEAHHHLSGAPAREAGPRYHVEIGKPMLRPDLPNVPTAVVVPALTGGPQPGSFQAPSKRKRKPGWATPTLTEQLPEPKPQRDPWGAHGFLYCGHGDEFPEHRLLLDEEEFEDTLNLHPCRNPGRAFLAYRHIDPDALPEYKPHRGPGYSTRGLDKAHIIFDE